MGVPPISVVISGVVPGSAADAAGILPGETLVSIDGHDIEDVLDYRFYMTSFKAALEIESKNGARRVLAIQKGEYEDSGLIFDTYLMDRQRRCKNRCVFCFIDQLPKGLRESLYFKDDDARMSFLFGNYITLTNLRERDIERIIKMRISPVNISVHTTNPALRTNMMGNKNAGDALRWIGLLAESGIRLNTQLVLCPGLNDGPFLRESLTDLLSLAPMMQSIAAVPVGLTKFRDGLARLRPFTGDEAAAVIDMIDEFGSRMEKTNGERVCYASDEFYLLAGRPLPPAGYYGAFDQLENGVGLWSLLREEFADALAEEPPRPLSRRVLIATGLSPLDLMLELASLAQTRFPGLKADVVGVRNDFFGERITVAGLVTGGDLIAQTKDRAKDAEALLIPAVMLRHERDLFLDSVSLDDVESALGLPVIPVENGGHALLKAMLGDG